MPTITLSQPLQSIIDPFVRAFGGELVADLISNVNPPSNADYLFRQHNVIAELKALERDSFNESFGRKIGALMGDWHRHGVLMVYGRQQVQLHRLPPVLQREFLEEIGRPLQVNVLNKANEQIRATKALLNMPEAKGLVLVASDGNEDLMPHDVWSLLTHILQKRHPDGTRQFSHIHALAYFNPRMLVRLPDSGQPTFLWLSGPRDNQDHEMSSFLGELNEAWFAYLSRALGEPIRQVDLGSVPLEELTFTGVRPPMPLIQVNDSSNRRRSSLSMGSKHE